MSQLLDNLRQQIGRLERSSSVATMDSLPFGIDSLDSNLGGGLALGGLHEISGERHPAHDAALVLFAAGILGRLTGSVMWCVRSADLFAPALAAVGLESERLLYAEARDDQMILRLMEEGLRHRGLAGVAGEVNRMSLTAARRLHLAARASGVTAFLIKRAPRFMKPAAQELGIAETHWRIAALPSSPLPVAGIGRSRWRVELLHSRTGQTGKWELEACDAQGRLAVPAELVDRPLAQDQRLIA